MSLPTLTIVVPTLGRPSLVHTLDSIRRQNLLPGDRVLVVLDTHHALPKPEVRALVTSYGDHFDYVEHDGGTHFYGNPQLNHAMTVATTDFFCALGDDDVYVDGAIERLRPQLVRGRAALCQFLSPPIFGPTAERAVVWDEPRLQVGNLSGCCLIAPTAALVPVKAEQRITVDFDWIVDVLAKTGAPPIWIAECLILARPTLTDGVPARLLADMWPVALTRPLRVLLCHPGANTSTADVEAGLAYGLRDAGVQVIPYRLDSRIDFATEWLKVMWRQTRKFKANLPKPTLVDTLYHASLGALEMALREAVDVVLVVSGMLFHPDVLLLMKRAGLKVTVLFTESPYDQDQELPMAALVDGCWTSERASVPAFRAVSPRAGYVPHGWHPSRHGVWDQDADVAAHDVVFVGSGFPERQAFFNAIDWTGIDLGLYGTWPTAKLSAPVAACVHPQIENSTAAALYRKAKINLNLYRSGASAESLSPRAYELAACGAFHLSEARAEVTEVFGDLVPTFTTPDEAATLIGRWLPDDTGRHAKAAALPARVAEASWVHRATLIVRDLTALCGQAA